MPQESLAWDTIGKLDSGMAGAAIDHAIQSAVKDLDDRGDDEKPRRVIIQLTMVKSGNGIVHNTVDCQTKLPPYRTHDTAGRFRQDSGGVKVMFQPHAPENPDQESLKFDEDGELQ